MNRVVPPVFLSLLLASLFLPVSPAHTPPGVNLDCQPQQAVHDYLMPGVDTDFAGAFVRPTVVDGSAHCVGSGYCLPDQPCCPGPVVSGSWDPCCKFWCPPQPGPAPCSEVYCCEYIDCCEHIDCCELCPYAPVVDGDWEFGVGGVFLPSNHHGNTIYVEDLVADHVQFYVGSDGNGDGVIAELGDDCVEGPFVDSGYSSCEPGADGGRWVLIAKGVLPVPVPYSCKDVEPNPVPTDCPVGGHVWTS